MQFKKRVAMKRSREEGSRDEQDASGEEGSPSSSSPTVPTTIVIEPDVMRNHQCESHSPCTSDSDDGEDEEGRVSPPSSSASSECSGIYYNNNEVRFPANPTSSSKQLFPAVIRGLAPPREVPSGRPLPCPPKLAITGSGHNISNIEIAVPTNASMAWSHCDYRKLQANFRRASPTTKTVSSLLAAKKQAKTLEGAAGAAGPTKKRTVSFHLDPEEKERSDERRGEIQLDGPPRRNDLSEDQRLFVEAAATLRQLGRQQQQQPKDSPKQVSLSLRRVVAGTSSQESSSGNTKSDARSSPRSLAPASPVARALPPPPSTLQMFGTPRLV